MRIDALEGGEYFTMEGWAKGVWKVAPSVDFQNTKLSHRDCDWCECVVLISGPSVGVVKFVLASHQVKVVG